MSNVTYANSPLLASKTPLWRSRFLVVLVGIGSLVLVGRAAYIQIIGTDFYLKQGEVRYAHTLEMPASRGRIVDRNGLLLATSVPTPSIWAIPKDVDADAGRAEAARAGAGHDAWPSSTTRLDGNPNFVWLKRQVDDGVGAAVKQLDIKGIHQVSEYRRRYPEGEAAAHVVGFTGDEDKGQEGIELAYQQQLQGRDGSREVVKDRLGRIVEDIGDPQRPINGEDIELVDRLQGAVLRLPAHARPGDRAEGQGRQRRRASTRRPARCWRWPTTRATTRASARTCRARSCATARSPTCSSPARR